MPVAESPSRNSNDYRLKIVSESSAARFRHRRRIETNGLIPFELSQCAKDVVYWLSNYGWTYDPRESPALVPFDPWPKQIEYLRWLEERETGRQGGLVEKTRDAGISYLCGGFAVHRFRFRRGSVGFGSRKEIYVDNVGDPDSLFEKMRILLESMPPWMKPKRWNPRTHATFCKFINPENGNTITGEAGDNIGRGGRKAIYFVDEAAFVERAELIDRSLAANTNCRIDVSTPNGIGNPFYVKRFSGTVPVFVFDWRDDPRKTEEWAAEKKREIGPVAWAQEYERDYSASIEGVCIPALWVKAAVNLVERLPLRVRFRLLRERGPQKAGYDIAEEGIDSNVLITGRGIVVNDVVDWGQCTTTQSAYRAVKECKRLIVALVNFDADGVGTGPKGIWMAMSDGDKALWNNGPVIEFEPIHTGKPPTNNRWPDGKTSEEKFGNLKAEAWWALRTRFERTYEFVEQGVKHPIDELISLPNHPQLIAEVSIPKVEFNDKGKIVIESKKQLRQRGVKSPDYAEALVLLFCPERRKLQAYVL